MYTNVTQTSTIQHDTKRNECRDERIEGALRADDDAAPGLSRSTGFYQRHYD